MKPDSLPTVGVVIPAYNAAACLPATLACVRDLDYPPQLLDVAVVDDGSTNETVRVAETALNGAGFSWRVLRQENRGPSAARNLGWRNVRGDWIQFLDADDLINADKLRHQGEAASTASAQVATVYSCWSTIERQNSAWKISPHHRAPQMNGDPVFQLLLAENFMQVGSQLFRRAWLERVNGFDERHSFIEDIDLALRMAMAGGQFADTNAQAPLFYFRQRPDSLSRSNGVQFMEGCARNGRLAEDHWRRRAGALTAGQTRLLLGIYGNALRVFYEHDRRRFAELFAHVRELDPRYRPAGPPMLRLLSGMLGYARAEAVALGYRRMKRAG